MQVEGNHDSELKKEKRKEERKGRREEGKDKGRKEGEREEGRKEGRERKCFLVRVRKNPSLIMLQCSVTQQEVLD
jgi:hypothetical protein